VPRKASPARLVIALSVAALLAIFLLYTSIAGGHPVVQPSQLQGKTQDVDLGGKVASAARGDARTGYRFRLRDVKGSGSVLVVYRDSLPDLFRVGREVSMTGRLRDGVFVANSGSLITKCPSKYSSKPSV
jgi:cytochrome c-type biogenesis protein CcmE